MQLQRLTALERQKIVEEHEQTLTLIEELKAILASDAKLMAIIKDELAGASRRSTATRAAPRSSPRPPS